MEEGRSMLNGVCKDEEASDVMILDLEEGELVERTSRIHLAEISGNQTQNNKVKNRKKKKKKKRRPGDAAGASNVTDINRFVLDTCRRLREKKSYMVYTAVGCLGVSALSELLKEVDAVQSCGGQMTKDGKRHRNGGGILWNIMKTREPMAYREIMKKSKEFEKQFKQQNFKQASQTKKDISPAKPCSYPLKETLAGVSYGSQSLPPQCSKESCDEGPRKSVHGRIRMHVSYDDLVGDDPKGDSL